MAEFIVKKCDLGKGVFTSRDFKKGEIISFLKPKKISLYYLLY